MTSITIAHLSDSHFGRLNDGAEAAMVRCLHRIKPELVLLSGDITQRARRDQFLAAREFVQRLTPITTFAVPGNHDIPLFNLPVRLISPYFGFHRYFQPRREAQFTFGDISITGLNSTSKWRHIQGALSLKRIRPPLERAHRHTGIRIVAIHHPMDCAKHVDEKNLIKNRDDVASVLAELGTDLILSGHIHDPYVSLSDARYPNLQRRMIIAVAGTCLSSRTRSGQPNSFNLIKIDTARDSSIKITRMDLAPDGEFKASAHAPASFERRDGGWSFKPHG